jgi:hypothetical protein
MEISQQQLHQRTGIWLTPYYSPLQAFINTHQSPYYDNLAYFVSIKTKTNTGKTEKSAMKKTK